MIENLRTNTKYHFYSLAEYIHDCVCVVSAAVEDGHFSLQLTIHTIQQ